MLKKISLYALSLDNVANKELESIKMTTSQGYDFIDLANKTIAYGILLAGFLSVVFMFFGGVLFIVSGGKEEKVKDAIHTIRYAIIGLLITILSVTIIHLIGLVFNLQLVNYIKFSHIVEIVNNVFK